MKPTLVADEMFPEGANFMELDEVRIISCFLMKLRKFNDFNSQPGSGSGLLMDLAANEKDVHADFFNGKLNTKAIDRFILHLLFNFRLRRLKLKSEVVQKCSKNSIKFINKI